MRVEAEGPLNATIAIVGEKGGREEVRLGRPFAGPTGREVNDLLLKVGTNRSNVYLTNACKEVPHFNTPTRTEIEAEQFALYKELSALPNLRVIVPMGATALMAMSNFQLDSIGSYRGSILTSWIGTKMVPTYHPAFYMRGSWKFKPIVKFDLARALEESFTKDIKLPERSYRIAETTSDLDQIRQELTTRVQYISFDIELMRGRYIECIAFAKETGVAYCIPITNGRRTPYWSVQDEVKAWATIQAILDQPNVCYIPKNGLFDCWHLWRHGITTRMENGADVEYMHRLRAPDLPHDLGFITSIYTREPYYKDESGSWDLQNRSVTDEQFYIYNCKDAVCTLESFFELRKDMIGTDQWDNYVHEVHSQWAAVTDMRVRGLHIDKQALSDVTQTISSEITSLQREIERYLGWLPNTRSILDMKKLYEQLGINYAKTSKGRPQMDKEILYTYAQREPKHRDVLYAIAEVNKARTLRSGFLNLVTDENDYYHPSLIIHKTKTGRLASKGSDDGGPQIQNIPKSLRHIVIPDDPELDELTNADLKGAEAMLLAWYTEDPLLLGSFQQKKDIHRVRACVIFRNWMSVELPPDEMLAMVKTVCNKCLAKGQTDCPHSERQLAKQSGHAMAYLEGVRRFCQEMRRQGIFIDESVAKMIRDKVVSRHIKNWHSEIETALRYKPWLETPLGKKREFYGALDQTLLREALSWTCQAVVGQITNRAMVGMDKDLRKIPHARLITQTHDSLTVTNRIKDREDVVEVYNKHFLQKLVIKGRELTIPIDITRGPNWRDMK